MDNKEQKSFIGVDLGATKLATGKVQAGEVVQTLTEPINAESEDPMETVRLIAGLVRSVMDDRVTGIGIGVPGLVDRGQGIVYDVINIPSWKEVHLGKILEDQFHLPVHLDNDSNCFAIGEYHYGGYAGTQDFVGITLGTGLGAGIIKNGSLLPDAHGCSGEFGTLPYLDGIVENYSSGMFFLNKFSRNGEEVADEAREGKQWALEAWEEFGLHLGNAIKNIIMAVDPGMIIIGGSIARANALFKEAMWRSVRDFSFPSALLNFEIVFSDTAHSAILGAAALCHNEGRDQ